MFFIDTKFLKAATERAVKSAAQAAVLMIGADQLDVLNADWQGIGSFAAGGLVLSYLTSFASGFVGERETPSVAGETLKPVETPEPLPEGFLDDLAGERADDEHRDV